MATQEQQNLLYEYMGFNDNSREAAESFDKLAKVVNTKYKPPISHPSLKPQPSTVQGTGYVNRAERTSPTRRGDNSSVPVTPNQSAPFDYSQLGELFINNPAIPQPPGGANVGQAAQARPITGNQFQVPSSLMFALTNLLKGV